MKNRFFVLILVWFFLPQFAFAKSKNSKTPTLTMGTCDEMLQHYPASKLWFGSFRGSKNEELGMDVFFREFKNDHACFLYEQDCRKWLYDLNTEFQDWPFHSECSLGFVKD